MEDAQLVQRVLQGDREAFDLLVAPRLTRAYRTACGITHHADAAADALQEALIRAYRALGNLRDGTAFYPWFMRIVVREALKQAPRATSPLPIATAADAATPEGALLDREEREQIWSTLQRLSPDHRAVVVLRYYEDLSEAEMAEVLGISPGTVKSRLHYARQNLERRLRRQEATGQVPRLAEGDASHD